MELLDIYDSQGRRTGRVIDRDDKVGPGEWLLIVHVCLFNSKGQMLIQRRQDTKNRYPGCWDVSAGGFARSGEDSVDCALRELSEELGLNCTGEQLHFLLTEPFSYVLDDFYLLWGDYDADSLLLQAEEVSGAMWAGWDEIRAMLSDGRFVDYDMGLMERIFALADSMAAQEAH